MARVGDGASVLKEYNENSENDKNDAMAESYGSTNSQDRFGNKKVTSFFPPATHRDSSGDTVSFSIPARIWLVLEDPSMGTAAKLMSMLMMVLIIASCVGFVVATIPDNQFIESDMSKCRKALNNIVVDCTLCHDSHDNQDITDGKCDVCAGYQDGDTVEVCQPVEKPIFELIETICIYCFTVDYLLRIGTVSTVDVSRWSKRGQYKSCLVKVYKYASGWLNIVDLVAIMPFWITVAAGETVPLGFLRVLRLARVFRIFKLGKYNEGMSLFARTLHASIPALSLLVFFVLIGVVLFGSIIYFVEGGTYKVDYNVCPESMGYACYVRSNSYFGHEDEMSPFVSIPYSFYWVMVTMTTVGYGDQFPQTFLGKTITVVCMLCGILTLALPITVLGSNFSAEYDAMHGGGEDEEGEGSKSEEEERLFWEKFASLVANSMIHDGNTRVPVNSQTTRDRLRKIMQSAAGEVISDVQSLSRSGGGGGGGGGNDDLAARLESTILELNSALKTLKSSSATRRDRNSMEVEEIDSPSSSPISFQSQTVTKISRSSASGAMSFPPRHRMEKKNLIISGEGELPCYFDIFTPKKLKGKTRFHFSPEPEGPPSVEATAGHVNDDIAEMERLVGVDADAAASSPSLPASSGGDKSNNVNGKNGVNANPIGGMSLNVRKAGSKGNAAARMKLARVGRSLSFGSTLMKVKKYDQSLGETRRKLGIEIKSACGLEGTGVPVSFTIVAGACQYETSSQQQESDGCEVRWGEKFEYDMPLSTHTGNMLVKSIEIIAHSRDKVLGVAVVPLTCVCGRDSEHRILGTNNSYLASRNLRGRKCLSKVAYAGSGRVKVGLTWMKNASGEHRYGTSFGRLMQVGDKFGELQQQQKGSDGRGGVYREPPEYPKVQVGRKRGGKRKTEELVVLDGGEAFMFDEGGKEGGGDSKKAAGGDVVKIRGVRKNGVGKVHVTSDNDDSSGVVLGGLVFPISSSETDSDCMTSTSPTESPGRSDTLSDDCGGGGGMRGGGGDKAYQGTDKGGQQQQGGKRDVARKLDEHKYRRNMVEEFVTNGRTPKGRNDRFF